MKIESTKSDEIDLRKIVSIIKEKIYFIIFITMSGTLASFLYLSTLIPIYSTSSFITSLSVDSHERLNQAITVNGLGKEVSSFNLLNDFLITLQSESFQQKSLSEQYYSNLQDLQKDNNEHELEIKSLLNSINVSILETNSFLGDVYQISIQGNNPNLITNYLNNIIEFSNNNVISQIEDRLNISRKNNIDTINYEISSLVKNDENYNLALIDELELELEIAKNLGIKDTNFEIIKTNSIVPNWFLLGENAIKVKIKNLRDKVSNSSKLKEAIPLMSKRDFLEQTKINLDGYNAVQLISSAKIPQSQYSPNNIKILGYAFFASFLGSIFLSLFFDLLRQDERKQ